MPNPKEYFHAAQIRPALCWCDRNHAAKWKNLEEFVQDREIQSLIGGRDETMCGIEQVDTITQFTLGQWFDIGRKHTLEKELGGIRWIRSVSPPVLLTRSLNNGFQGE